MISRLIVKKWRTVKGFPRYQVSNYGDVRSKSQYIKYSDGRVHFHKGRRFKKYKTNSWGYLTVSLSVNNRPFWFSVHSLVCRAFYGPKPSPKHVVNHKDADKTNNRADNLEWSTKSDDAKHAIRLGLRVAYGQHKRWSQ